MKNGQPINQQARQFETFSPFGYKQLYFQVLKDYLH